MKGGGEGGLAAWRRENSQNKPIPSQEYGARTPHGATRVGQLAAHRTGRRAVTARDSERRGEGAVNWPRGQRLRTRID